MWEKKVSEMDSKKGTLQYENQELWTCPGAPREAASRAHFSNKKQEFEHKFQELLLELVICFSEMFFLKYSATKNNRENVKST